jgi:hypothetical protein
MKHDERAAHMPGSKSAATEEPAFRTRRNAGKEQHTTAQRTMRYLLSLRKYAISVIVLHVTGANTHARTSTQKERRPIAQAKAHVKHKSLRLWL